MKKIRYLPFGYTIRNGHTVVEQQEADIVRNIFKAYIQGASLKEIAEDLTAKQIPYTERTCVWDKARISRILENAKYTGDEEFETIIDENIYEEAAAVKSARRWNQAVEESEGIRQIRDRIRCGQCGATMLRHINSKRIAILPLGRSRPCPTLAKTRYLLPNIFSRVFALAGDSTTTSVFPS